MRLARAGQLLDVGELASRRAVLAGSVEPRSMRRLAGIVTSVPPGIRYHVEFMHDAARRPRIEGRIEGALSLVCQRCLGDFDWQFDIGFECLVVGGEHEAADGHDALICPAGRLGLETMIEDELLLALPNAPVHAHGSCTAPPASAVDVAVPGRANPFSILRSLRPDHHRDRSS